MRWGEDGARLIRRRYPNKQIGGSELKTSECCPTPRSGCCQRYPPAAYGKRTLNYDA